MSAIFEPEHLSNHQRDTLLQLFQHPTSHNIKWQDVLSLLETAGEVEPSRDGKTAVLAWEYDNVVPSSSGFEDMEFDQANTGAKSQTIYEVNLLGQFINIDEAVMNRAQAALDAYNNPASAD